MRTTEHTTDRPKTKRGSRGNPDRPSARRFRERSGLAPRGEARRERDRPRNAPAPIPEAPEGWGGPESRERYARVFRAALLQAVQEIGGPVDAGDLTLAYSRAALRTWDLARLLPEDAERTRLQVLAEEREALRVEALRGGFDLGTHGAHGERLEVERLGIPRAPALDDERIRRGGRR